MTQAPDPNQERLIRHAALWNQHKGAINKALAILEVARPLVTTLEVLKDAAEANKNEESIK